MLKMPKMHIILLCGGAGTRLWPLSNQSRSKQFIKLFKAPDGTPESMFQRILRQLRQALPDADINIAASSSQTDSVMAQAPTDISIIIEPSRRDTFPAIALASSYLAWEKGIGKDEVVVVMPCDTFTEPGYFHAISEMSAAVESDLAELVLMGIEPESPSAKYGYIVPATSAPGIVDRFIEKPDAEKSRSLIAEGALWNGGVFAFKLGYMLDIVSGYSTHENFGKIREAYDDFPKISFDYEVAEKAKSVGIVRYNGVWKDLGTWAALCKELPGHHVGQRTFPGQLWHHHTQRAGAPHHQPGMLRYYNCSLPRRHPGRRQRERWLHQGVSQRVEPAPHVRRAPLGHIQGT